MLWFWSWPQEPLWFTVFASSRQMGPEWSHTVIAWVIVLPLRGILSLAANSSALAFHFFLQPHPWLGVPEAGLLLREGMVSVLLASHGAQGRRGSLAAVTVVFATLATSGCCWQCGLESLARHLLGLGAPHSMAWVGLWPGPNSSSLFSEVKDY